MQISARRTRQVACVATIVTLTALVSLSTTRFKTSAANSPINFNAALALSYAPLAPPPPAVITNSGTANDIIYNLPAGDGDNLAILEDDGVPGNGLSQLRSGNGSFVTVVFANPANTIAINASNDGEKITVNNMDSGFVAKINLKGGTAADTFALGDGATLKGGTVNGNGGPDTLDYSSYTTTVSVNLGLNASFYQADITAIQETPPNTSTAVGTATNAYDTSTHRILGLDVSVTNITPAQITGLKLRRGPVNSAGPVVADLIGLGSLTPSGNGFHYNAGTVPVPPEQEAGLMGGLLYVEVETTAFPGGEVRGQIMPNGPIGPTPPTATGIANGGVAGITIVIGGSGNDSLVGSTGDELLRGGPGDDTLYAGPGFGNDRMQGEGGNDTILFNSLDNPFGGLISTDDGGPGSDLVNFNGRPGVDSISLEPAGSSLSGPGRLLFHSGTGADLDIGTVETLTVSGFSGNDTFTVGSLVGVNDLTAINFNGLFGNDTSNITPSATVTFTINGGDLSPPTFPGDLLNLNTTGVTNLALTATSSATGTQGAYTFGNRQPVNFLTLEAVNPSTIRVNDVTLPEGNAGSTGAVFTVSLDAPTNATVTVDYVTFNGTAVSPGDYQGLNGTVTFSPGQTTRFITVPVNGDTQPESNETFVLNLSNPVGAVLINSQGVCTIVNDDAVTPPPSISVNNVSITEGNSGSSNAVFTVTLSAASTSAVSVDAFTSNGTATAPVDYQSSATTLTFLPGVTTATFSVPVNGDTTHEGNETFFVNLTGAINATISVAQATGTILDDDPVPATPSISISNVAITEGNSGSSNAMFTATLSAASTSTVSVDAFTSNGTATAPVDYQSSATTLTFLPGVTTANFSVPVNGDTTHEENETFFVNLTNAINATIAVAQATGTILDDDPVPATPSISINNVAVTEGNSGSSNATFTATLSAASAEVVSVDASTANGTATAPVDYQTAGTTLTFAPGVTTANFNVAINGDTTPEGNETFFVNLTNPVNATIATAQGTGTINDDDSTNIFQFSSPTASVAENAVPGRATVTVTRSGDTSGAANVKFETSDGTAKQKTDYTFGYGTLQFGPGETSKNVQVLIVNDVSIEGPKTFQVSLSSPSGNSAIGSPGTIVVTITDDDVAAAPNPIDDAGFFVRQHYLDFLGREPDASGLAFWTSNITSCGANPGCVGAKRVSTSAAFFLSIEFQETGGYALRIQRTAFGKQSNDPFTRYPYLQFMRDSRTIGQGVVVGQPGYDTLLEQNKQAYAVQTVLTSEFTLRFPPAPAAVYVDALFASAGATPTAAERTAAINSFGAGGTTGRVAALRSVTDSASVRNADFTPSFVLAEYYGYLRRNPTDAPDFSDAGYQFWFNKLNAFNGNYIDSEMVKAFITSSEYRQRFGTP